MITPLLPREPYKAAEAASINVEMEATSVALILARSPSYTIPSTTISGLLPADIEPNPRTRIFGEPPGCPLLRVLCMPGAEPVNASAILVRGLLAIWLSEIWAIAPVTEDLFCDP